MTATLSRIFAAKGFEQTRAELCARLFAEATQDGVYTHGVERVPRFLKMIESGVVDVHAQPIPVRGYGAVEAWDGQRGPGNLNARWCMARAIELSLENAIGCVALGNTNHWMRAGSYGWQAAEAGVIGMCWTNTLPNVPAWGSSIPSIGNNPLVIAVPRPAGHVVLDMAVTQFSYGALGAYRARGEMLPVPGGFDTEGNITRDPGAIEKSQRLLPIGYWKGSALAVMLDMVASMLSGGLATHEMSKDPMLETGLSQVFVAWNIQAFQPPEQYTRTADAIVASLLQPGEAEGTVRYPGEKVLKTRAENQAKGIPVREALWNELLQML
jgi:3-dehydro-L-gulonate 2-dehydrogenase